jgi:hypothetical protein
MQGKHESSILPFFVLVFVLFIPFWIWEAIHPVELLPGLPSSALAAFTPAVAALILTYKQDRLAGVRQLLQRSFDLKRIKNQGWLLLVLLVNPLIAGRRNWLDGICHGTARTTLRHNLCRTIPRIDLGGNSPHCSDAGASSARVDYLVVSRHNLLSVDHDLALRS